MSDFFGHRSSSSGKAAIGIHSVRNARIGVIRDALHTGTRQARTKNANSVATKLERLLHAQSDKLS
jgi:hypothetical protein